MNSRAILLLVCRDQPGLVASITQWIFEQNGNILDSDQHSDIEAGAFFMRIEWELRGLVSKEALEKSLKPLTEKFLARARLYFVNEPSRVAIFASKAPHCLYDLLLRWRLREFRAEIPLVISNHRDLEPVARHFEIPFFHVPVLENQKEKAEATQLSLLSEYKIDLVVLARYMQVLSPHFVSIYPHRIINIHHSFLPAFAGARPYEQAYARGVKLIGATSHYVTEALDEGPIIAQNVTRVSHRDRVEDLVRKGRDQEKLALSLAVRMHLERRVLAYENKTIVFE